MTPRIVCDTSALVALGLGEKGADKVLSHLRGGGCVMHEVNVSETCFTLPRKHPDGFDPDYTRVWLERSGLATISGFSWDVGRLTARIRLAHRALSFGDGVALALAFMLGVPLLTADRAFAEAKAFATIELIR